MNKKTTTTYTINGQKYHSIDEIPADLRHLVEDLDGNGRPDWVDERFGAIANGSTKMSAFKELDQLPSDATHVKHVEVRTTTTSEVPASMRSMLDLAVNDSGISSLWDNPLTNSLLETPSPPTPEPPTPVKMPQKALPPVIPGMLPSDDDYDRSPAASAGRSTNLLLAALSFLLAILITTVLLLLR